MDKITDLPGGVLLIGGIILQRLEEAEDDIGDAEKMRAHLDFMARQLSALIVAAHGARDDWRGNNAPWAQAHFGAG